MAGRATGCSSGPTCFPPGSFFSCARQRSILGNDGWRWDRAQEEGIWSGRPSGALSPRKRRRLTGFGKSMCRRNSTCKGHTSEKAWCPLGTMWLEPKVWRRADAGTETGTLLGRRPWGGLECSDGSLEMERPLVVVDLSVAYLSFPFTLPLSSPFLRAEWSRASLRGLEV